MMQDQSLEQASAAGDRGIFTAVLVLFLISGATGLAYEVVWIRLLVRVFGTTSFALTTVLAAYMAGLALGSYLFGRMIDRKGSPIRIYGMLELGIGAFALVFPVLINLINPVYVRLFPFLEGRFYWLSALRFGLGFSMLIIPTTLMGGTLPVLSKLVVRDVSHLTSRVGTLYAVNTLGAVAGALGAGFLLLPFLGIGSSTWLCAGLNLTVFAAAMVIDRRGVRISRAAWSETSSSVSGSEEQAIRDRLVLVAFLLTGFCALSVEVIWTRVLTLVLGTTTYAFTIMLGTFLLGLGLGSWVFAAIGQRTAHPGRILGFLVAGLGVVVFLSGLAFNRLPLLYMSYYEQVQPSWTAFLWIQFLLCFLTMLVPTFLMGGTFPLVARMFARKVGEVGTKIGSAYALNTLGAIAGSFAGSFIFLRYFGIKGSISLVSSIYLGIGLFLLLGVAGWRTWRDRWPSVAAVGVVGVLMLALAPAWNKELMTSGVYRYFGIYQTVDGLRESIRDRKIIFYNDGPGATVTVSRLQNELSLVIDGKADASTGISDMTLQVLLAHIPMLLQPRPDTVLVIGLGSGVTLGSVESYDLESVDCVELLENVVRAATCFKTHTHDCLADPRLNLILGDARNHLLLSRSRYDVIISEPTNPWISGVGDLFTAEFFQMAKSRLKPQGLISVWFQTYHMGEEDVKAVINTFTSVFPYAWLWMASEMDLILLGSQSPLVFSPTLTERFDRPRVASDLRRIRVDDPADVLAAFVSAREGLAALVGDSHRLHTDDNMFLEFSAGRKLARETSHLHLANILRIMQEPPIDDLASEVREQTELQMEARRMAIRGTLLKLAGKPREALMSYDQAFARGGSDQYVLCQYVSNNLAVADMLLSRGDYRGAADYYGKAVVDPEFPDQGMGYHGLGVCHLGLGDLTAAAEYFQLAIRKNPYSVASHYGLARLEEDSGNLERAIAGYLKVLELEPHHADAAQHLARIYAGQEERLSQALKLARMAVRVAGRADHHITLALVYQSMGDLGSARSALEKALKIDPGNKEALLRLAEVDLSEGRRQSARELLKRMVELGGDDAYSRKARLLLESSLSE